MDPEIEELKELIRQNTKLTEDTNHIVHGMRRSARVGTFIHILYWIVILGVVGTSYFFVSPYVKQAAQMYSNIQSGAAQAQTTGNDIQSFFKKFLNYFSPQDSVQKP